jgi:hypothetical protein
MGAPNQHSHGFGHREHPSAAYQRNGRGQIVIFRSLPSLRLAQVSCTGDHPHTTVVPLTLASRDRRSGAGSRWPFGRNSGTCSRDLMSCWALGG